MSRRWMDRLTVRFLVCRIAAGVLMVLQWLAAGLVVAVVLVLLALVVFA